MSEEKKNVPLSEDELGSVAGGHNEDLFPDESIWPNCPRCGTKCTHTPYAEHTFDCPNCGWYC